MFPVHCFQFFVSQKGQFLNVNFGTFLRALLSYIRFTAVYGFPVSTFLLRITTHELASAHQLKRLVGKGSFPRSITRGTQLPTRAQSSAGLLQASKRHGRLASRGATTRNHGPREAALTPTRPYRCIVILLLVIIIIMKWAWPVRGCPLPAATQIVTFKNTSHLATVRFFKSNLRIFYGTSRYHC